MTTTVKVHVNGQYRAFVTQTNANGTSLEPIKIEGNYKGSPNPSGEASFHLSHPASATFAIREEFVPDSEIAAF